MTTKKILLALAVVTLLAVVAGRLFFRHSPDLKTTPPELVGTWTTDHPGYSDRYVELKPDTIIFGTGGTSFVLYTILGVDRDPSAAIDGYTVYFRDAGGNRFQKDIVLRQEGPTFYFKNQADVIWTRLDR